MSIRGARSSTLHPASEGLYRSPLIFNLLKVTYTEMDTFIFFFLQMLHVHNYVYWPCLVAFIYAVNLKMNFIDRIDKQVIITK